MRCRAGRRPAPRGSTNGRWTPCTPKTAGTFSAVGYFFGRKLGRDLDVPIGLIQSDFGGTPAESWTPDPALRGLTNLPGVQRLLARADAESTPAALEAFFARTREWMAANGRADPGISADARGWADPTFDDGEWKPIAVPSDFAKAGVPSGSTFWARRAFDVPAELAGKPFMLTFGPIDDFDQTFVNGQPVGSMGLEAVTWTTAFRYYRVPGAAVRAGRNVVAVRVHDLDGRAGFTGNAYQVRATFDAPSGGEPAIIPLAGTWRYAIERPGPTPAVVPGTTRPTTLPARPAVPLRPDSPQYPSSLYNAMIAPLGEVSLKGVIWYQGESNASRAGEYAPLLSTMIATWREQFRPPALPFYIVGLANYRPAVADANVRSEWGELRQAQRDVARTVPNTATTVTIDVGEASDIHPRDKRTVGERLALVALADAYGKTLVSRGPTLTSATRAGGRVTLAFANVGGGLAALGEKLGPFSVAGADGKFAWADAAIVDDTVVVSAASVAEPTVVRYAYADNPTPTLFNKEGLPAEPFEERVK